MERIELLIWKAENAGIKFCFDRLGAMSLLMPCRVLPTKLVEDVRENIEAIQDHLVNERNVYAGSSACEAKPITDECADWQSI